MAKGKMEIDIVDVLFQGERISSKDIDSETQLEILEKIMERIDFQYLAGFESILSGLHWTGDDLIYSESSNADQLTQKEYLLFVVDDERDTENHQEKYLIMFDRKGKIVSCSIRYKRLKQEFPQDGYGNHIIGCDLKEIEISQMKFQNGRLKKILTILRKAAVLYKEQVLNATANQINMLEYLNQVIVQ